MIKKVPLVEWLDEHFAGWRDLCSYQLAADLRERWHAGEFTRLITYTWGAPVEPVLVASTYFAYAVVNVDA